MKKILTYTLLLLFSFSFAQKMAYVDTQYILKQMPQYQQSEQRLSNEVKKWQDEIVRQQSTLEKLRVEFENDKVLLTDAQQKTKLSVIDSTDKVLHEFIEKKFGANGESISLRLNLVKPLQDQIWNAINAVSAKDKYNIVFDKSSDLIMIFTDAKYDITDKVLKQLGVATKDNDGRDTKSSSIKTTGTKKTTDSDKTSKTTSTKKSKESDSSESNKEKSKSGYGSKYVPKKQQNKTEVKEQKNEQDNSGNIDNTTSEKIDTKVEEPSVEIKEEDTAIKKEEKKTETKTQPKSGYGSKYVPKKKAQNNQETNNNK